jgi:hypothetical protein
VDNVLAIRKGLTENEGEAQQNGSLETSRIPTLPEETLTAVDDNMTALSIQEE